MGNPTLSSLHKRLKKAESIIAQQQEQLKLMDEQIMKRLELIEEAQGESVTANIEAFRILWLCCGRQNLEKQRERLVLLGNTLKEYQPELDEATA